MILPKRIWYPDNRVILKIGYLNYPTQVVFKCCKLIPVLIGGIILQRKKFSIMDFVAAMSMCIGLAIFTLADSKVIMNILNMFDFLNMTV